MSYMECSEFVETSRKFKEQIRSGAEIIKKIAKSMNRDDEYFESGHRRTFLEPLDQQLKSLLKYDQDLHNHIESFRSTLFQVSRGVYKDDRFVMIHV